MTDGIGIELLDEGYLPEALRLTEQSRWNQTERDWRRLLQLRPWGCFGAVLDGHLIGTVTTVVYGTELAWIGMMLVDPDYRRRGLGTRLMRAALEHLQRIGVKSIKLDATPAGRPLYESLGFRPEGLIERWEGRGQPGVKKKGPAWGERLCLAVYAFDRLAFGADRSPILASLITDSPVAPLVAMTPEGQLQGFALTRPGRQAFYIGPVAARGRETALALLDGMLGRLRGENVYLDFNTSFGLDSSALADRGLVKQRDLTQMAFGPESPAGISDRIMGLAGPEMG
ncbi:MAG TPA: GNAT family N-acetyltransferase [candidate division Zixibacteria bacterium]|jgi:GNAT superfamily N-acetyltransferase|nr:GNAT family N-acetyltransferase [candidate division Zixibacteria bacterium]